MSKVYISGPIKDEPNYEDNFEQREKTLIEMGYSVCNPVKLGKELEKKSYKKPSETDYLKYDIIKLLDCDSINFLEGAEHSEGSLLEKMIADKCGIPTINVMMCR